MERGVKLVNIYYLFNENKEATDHVLIHRWKSQILWDLILLAFGVSWVMVGSVKEICQLGGAK